MNVYDYTCNLEDLLAEFAPDVTVEDLMED